ncbi:MAG: RNA polymerase factor sigma-54 [Planctomycetes bacterium]|nr:RNA polymerase factor sigma-54 [Planctomycetota bacterium]
MRFETSQHMKLGQQMKLSPRMIQSMEILQMPMAELEERIEQELESNIALELIERSADSAEIARQQAEARRDESADEQVLDTGASDAHDFERLARYETTNPDAADNAYSASGLSAQRERAREYEPSGPAPRAGERDSKLDALAATPARSASLIEQLLDQWRLVDVDERTMTLGEAIIGFLEGDGYLRTPVETVRDRLPHSVQASIDELNSVLDKLQQSLDPPGVGARDVRECLLLQIDALERERGSDDPLETARWLVEDHLDDLMNNRLPRIADRTTLSLDEIKIGIEQLKRLSLAPGRRLVNDPPAAIVPDATVEYDDDQDRYIAYLNDTRLPNIQINKAYAEMARDRDVPKTDREFIRKNLSNAQWLIDAMGQRRHTLLRVINVVVDAQRDYFDFGSQALKPLPMTQIAEQLGVHVATVSRAVADKHLQTPRGIVPLRGFFSGGLQTESGIDVSYDAVKAALKEVVDAEDKSKPLSDEALVRKLNEQGIEIARRTVAKYRGQLDIPSARLRKTY